MRKIFNQLIFPASLLATTIIGAGMFALPYLFEKAGILTGLFYLIFFGTLFALIHLMYADIIVRTPENRRLSGYARIYLGKIGYWLSVFMTIFGALLVLTIYLVLSISFMKLILPVAPDIYIVSIFWFLGSLAIFFSIKELALSDFFIFMAMAAMIFIIFGFGFYGGLERVRTVSLFNLGNLFLPFGAVLFSMYGRSAIPALLGYFRNNGQSPIEGRRPIIIGSVAPAVIYAIFVFGILGLSNGVSPDAVSGLVKNLSPVILWILGILGTISLWSTYIIIGRDIKKSLEHDFGAPLVVSGLTVMAAPILFYTSGFQNFLQLVEFVGAIIIGLEGVFIVLMWLKASKIASEHKMINKLSPLSIGLLLLVFVGGIVYKVIMR